METETIAGIIILYFFTNFFAPFLGLANGCYEKKKVFYKDVLIPACLLFRAIISAFKEAKKHFSTLN